MEEELDICPECGFEFEYEDVSVLIYPDMLPNGSVGQCLCKNCLAYLSELFLDEE